MEIIFRLAREADDESGAQRNAGNTGPDFGDEIFDVFLRSFATHPFEHVLMNVLQGNIDIARDFGALGDGLDQFVRPMRRMSIEQPNPEIPGELV